MYLNKVHILLSTISYFRLIVNWNAKQFMKKVHPAGRVITNLAFIVRFNIVLKKIQMTYFKFLGLMAA